MLRSSKNILNQYAWIKTRHDELALIKKIPKDTKGGNKIYIAINDEGKQSKGFPEESSKESVRGVIDGMFRYASLSWRRLKDVDNRIGS